MRFWTSNGDQQVETQPGFRAGFYRLNACNNERQVAPHLSASARQSGFTMVEVALSLGVLAFALVAIIGVLPSGMKVQKENREQTVINQDATYLLEAIRSGSKGVDDLTNYVESITVRRGNTITTYTNNVFNPGPYVPLTNAQHIVSLLSTPKYEWLPTSPPSYRLNSVTAQVRALSGNALEKGAGMQDFALRYRVTCEVNRFTNYYSGDLPSQFVGALRGDALRGVNLARNLYEVRVTVQWPLYQKGTTWTVGRYSRTVRTLVSGELLPTYTNSVPYLYLFQPDTFVSAY
jgi:type II secretory pathway pseudopilin PulG